MQRNAMSATDARDSMVALEALLEIKRKPTVSTNNYRVEKAAEVAKGDERSSRVPKDKSMAEKQDDNKQPPPPSVPKDMPMPNAQANGDGKVSTHPPAPSVRPSQPPLQILAPRGLHTVASNSARPGGVVSAPAPYAGMVQHQHRPIAYQFAHGPAMQMIRNAGGLTAASGQASLLPLTMPVAASHPRLLPHAALVVQSAKSTAHQATKGPVANFSPAGSARVAIQGNQVSASQAYMLRPVPIAPGVKDDRIAQAKLQGQLPVPPHAQSGKGPATSAASNPSSGNGQGSGTSPASVVRAEEVEAALRSKPQRGKKRENLTPTERQELTRTRNREHARSTRVRKKARYDELVSNEEKYLEFKVKEDLSEARRKCVVDFFEIRSSMMKEVASRSDAKPPGTSSTPQQPSSEVPPPVLKDVLDNVWHFEISVMGLQGEAQHGVAAMRELDLRIVDFVKSRHGDNAVSTLRFRGTCEGIAIAANDMGFAQVELVAKPTDDTPEEIVMTLTTQFKFVSGSPKIHSLSWSSPNAPALVTIATNAKVDPKSDGSPQKLAVFPTVISFDNSSPVDNAGLPHSRIACAIDETNINVHQSPGPGMNI